MTDLHLAIPEAPDGWKRAHITYAYNDNRGSRGGAWFFLYRADVEFDQALRRVIERWAELLIQQRELEPWEAAPNWGDFMLLCPDGLFDAEGIRRVPTVRQTWLEVDHDELLFHINLYDKEITMETRVGE